MFSNPKINLILHAIGQMVAQAGILEAVQDPFARSILQVVVSLVGVLIAFSDQTISKGKNNEAK